MTNDELNGEVPVVNEGTNGGDPAVNEFSGHAPASETKEIIKCDVLVIGAGFSGITAIDRLRKIGLKVKAFESGTGFGGVWYWNRYPGARVDSEAPYYQLNIPEVYRKWNFTERFPDHTELRKYVAHIDETLGLKKDTYFKARVNDCSWDDDRGVWTVKTEQGHVSESKYILLASGLLHRTYTPAFEGLQDFKGELYHSGAWPEGFSAKGKKVAIIGAGATAVQITQELGKEADQMTVLVRRPSFCLPMQQRPLSVLEQSALKAWFPKMFEIGRDSAVGFPAQRQSKGAFDVSTEEREELYEELWARGGFNFGLNGYNDTAISKDANKVAYDFWARKVRARLTDPKKHAIMAPEVAPYYFGTKRNPLEQDYYEVLNQPNATIVDLSSNPLKSFHEKGLLTSDGTVHEFDAIVLATGFDSFTGSATRMGLKNHDGIDLKDVWKEGVSTYLGLTIPSFPNVFLAYSPQSPTALSNGPTIIEAQVETIVDMIFKLEKEKAHKIEAQPAASVEWKAMLSAMTENTLFPFTDSWWNGANIPGKKKENMTYIGGINNYEAQCRATMDGWKGFDIASAKA